MPCSLATLLGNYEAATPGVEGADGITVILGDESEPQPDLCLRVLPGHGGQSKENKKQYVTGPPELVIEVADGTMKLDLRDKLADYRAGGVREYLVFCVKPGELRVFHLARDKQSVARDTVYQSSEFPGLWIDVGALAAKDVRRLLATGRAGVASDEHADFLERLGRHRKASRRARPRRAK